MVMLYRHVDRDHVGGLTDKVLVYGSCRKVQIDGECRWVRKMFSPRDKRLDADWVARERARHERNKRRRRLHEDGER